eukprot:TCONS_00005760-protein
MADRLFMYSWYHGEISRPTSEEILLNQSPGLFLVRDSTSCKGGYVLSVSENRKVSHYIITNRQGQYHIGDQVFNDLPDIVEFYKRHFLDTTTLVEPAARQVEPEPEAPAARAPPQESIKVKAKYNFPGNDPEDLPFRKNDNLTILKKEEDQWWLARDSQGKEGMIPANYVEVVRTTSTVNTMSNSSTSTRVPSITTGSGGYTTPNNTSVPSTVPTATTVPAIAEAIQDRVPSIYDPYELKFQKGERILVLKMREDGIWEGQLKNGKKGIFPFRYVKIVSSSPQDVDAWNNS